MSIRELLSSVVGGGDAVIGRFTYEAALIRDSQVFCGATLISSNAVISSGACFPNDNSFTVALGCENLSDLSACEIHEVSNIFKSSGLGAADSTELVIVHLATSTSKAPILVADSTLSFDLGTDLSILGWGSFTDATTFAKLQEGIVESVDTAECNNQVLSVFELRTQIPPEDLPGVVAVDPALAFCAVGDGADYCGFDSGGPALLKCNSLSNADVLVGVMNSNSPCAYDGLPTIYNKIFTANAKSFIQTTLSGIGSSATFVSSLSNFCGGNAQSEVLKNSPTPFPTFNFESWVCGTNTFAEGLTCNCGCGLPDPDCDFINVVSGCSSSSAKCVQGQCVESEDDNIAAIAGGVAGGVAFVAVIGVVVFALFRKGRQ